MDLLLSYTLNAQHLAMIVIDASGKMTTFTYNPAGQVLTVRSAKDETWTLTYDDNGYLQSVTGPVQGATMSLTWDAYGRVRTVTNADKYTITLDYDALDRPTRIGYPNGTYEEVVYDRLHPSRYRDLRGRWSHLFVDALRRPTAIRDALWRRTTTMSKRCGKSASKRRTAIGAASSTRSWLAISTAASPKRDSPDSNALPAVQNGS